MGHDDVRLLTLTGPGGIGKTRLAIALAEELDDAFADGVVFVELAPLRDPDRVPAAIATVLNIRETGPPLISVIRELLAKRQLLLVLDNFEHLLPAAPAVTDLLAAAPKVKALVTSRQPLRLRGEREFPVPHLGLPNAETPATADSLLASPAVALFIERAQAVNADFAVMDDDAAAVAEIVLRLDGLPLAIELAAVWCRALPPRTLAQRLQRRLPLLSSGAGDAPARHQTMRDAIAWSYHLLSPEEQTLFRRLAVFAGGFTLDAAEAIDESGAEMETMARLSRLIDAGLVQAHRAETEGVRYRMLGTIREFAHELLTGDGEEIVANDRHATIYLDLVEMASPHLHGALHLSWLRRLNADHDNMRAALDWAITRGQSDRALRLGAGLWLYWLTQGHWTEGRAWLRRVLALGNDAPSTAHAEVQFGAANLAAIQGNLDDAGALYDASLMEWRQVGSQSGIARTLSLMGIVALHNLRFAQAVELLRDAMPLFDLPQDEPYAALAMSNLGIALVGLGDLDGGIAQAELALARQQAYGENWAIASALIMLGDILVAKGEHQRAAALFADGLKNWEDSGITGFVLLPLVGLAKVASAAGRPVDAARLIGFHDAVADHASAVVNPYYEQLVSRAAETASQRLGDQVFEVERAAARIAPLDSITPEALRIASELAASA